MPSSATSAAPELDAAEIGIRNAGELCERGQRDLRAVALGVAAAGLRACDPRGEVLRRVALRDSALVVDGVAHPLGADGRVVVLGAGKASLRIAAALAEVAGERIGGGLVAVPAHGQPAMAQGEVDVLAAGHPLPTDASEEAATRLLELAAATRPEDLVVACFTGGSSALASLPPDGVSSAEKRELHRALLAAGMPIVDVNTVRKHVSGIKGGRLAAAVPPGRLVNLTVSDVAGDHLDAITDPTVADSTTPADAIAVLRAYGLWDGTAPSIRTHLESSAAASPALDGETQSVLLLTGSAPCAAMAAEAERRGCSATIVSTSLEGEARDLGSLLAALARESHDRGEPFRPPAVLVGCGGESTVTLPPGGRFGAGGPNQEAALAAALALSSGPRVAAAFLDTDGADGSTAVAGAIADGESAERARSAGIDLREALRSHGSGAAIEGLGDAIVTGATGTNVNDLFAIAIGEREGGAR